MDSDDASVYRRHVRAARADDLELLVTALRFYETAAVDGRAYLRRRSTSGLPEAGRVYQPDLWLVRHRRQLVLIADSDSPGVRFVADDERVEAQPDGTFRLCLNVLDDEPPDVIDALARAFYFGRRTFAAQG